MTRKPLVSVLMPYRKKDKFFSLALKSLKNQTYKRLEILAEEDLNNEGLTVLLNRLAKKAKGGFLARMDADDISEPGRIEKQVRHLESNQGVMLVGTWATLIDESGKEIGIQKMPSTWQEIKNQAFYRNPLIHPSWMMRREWFIARGGYDESYAVVQDWEFISRWAWTERMENIPEALISLRLHPKSVSFQKNRLQVGANFSIRWQMIKKGKVRFWRVLELFPSFISWFLPVGFKYNLRKNLLISDVRSGTRYQHQFRTLGIVLPIGQNRNRLEESGQWSLWQEELKFYRKNFKVVEFFEYQNSDWRRYIEALSMPILYGAKFRRCRVLKAVHLTGAAPCLMAKLLYGIPYVLSYGYRYDEFAAVEKKWGAWLLAKILTPSAIKFADAVMVPTRTLADYVEKAGAKRIEIIPNGVDTAIFKPKAKKGVSLHTQGDSFSENKSGIKLLFVGRLEKQKNLDTLIKAIAKLSRGDSLLASPTGGRLKGISSLKLLFVGSGSQKRNLQSLAKKLKVRLVIKTPVENRLLPEIYRQADIFVLPSLIEGHPKALLEAMSCGLPCLASDIPGADEIIVDGKNGLLVEPSVDGLTGGFKRLIGNPDLRYRLEAEARKTIVDRFDKSRLMREEILLLTIASTTEG